MLRFIGIFTATAIGAVPLPEAGDVARAAEFSPHHEHAWIGKHKTKSGVSCCDHTDCFVPDPREVVEKPDGYQLREFNEIVPHEDRKVSEDGRFYPASGPTSAAVASSRRIPAVEFGRLVTAPGRRRPAATKTVEDNRRTMTAISAP